MKPRYYSYISLLLLGIIITFGYINRVILKESISWSDRSLDWNDFQPVHKIEGSYDAAVYSDIYYPKRITKDDSKVYAFMDPNQSEWVNDSLPDSQLLKHEQYHFNITEYHARLLRKEVVKKGINKINKFELRNLYEKYERKRNLMQNEYDEDSDHNIDYQKQRYWELKIDDLLRHTAYYSNPDIYSYYNYTGEKTTYFKHLYYTQDHKILTSYPTSKIDSKNGSCYQVLKKDNEVIIEFYKNGELTNGGYFRTAITKIIKPSSNQTEVHYYNSDKSYNTSLNRCISKTTWKHRNMTISFFNQEEKPATSGLVHTIVWKYDPKSKTKYSTYYDLKGNPTPNNDGAHHERRKFDDQGRAIKIVSFDSLNNPINDKDYVSVYDYVYDDFHKLKRARLYDKSGDFATHVNEYNKHFVYDERGNLIKFTNLNESNDQTENNNGICIYKYAYDLNDNITSVKRYNAKELPVLGYNDYFQEIIDYDSKNRVKFRAKYLRDYVLAFDDDKRGAYSFVHLNDSIYYRYNIDAYNTVYNDDYGVGIVKIHHDKKGNIIRQAYYDYENCATTSEDGVEVFTYQYDDKGNNIQQSSFDSFGNPKPFNQDVAIIRWNYDERGNKIKTTFYTVNDKLANGNQNITYNLYKYHNNLLVEKTNYDKHMNPAQMDGVFKTKFYYNDAEQETVFKEYNARNRGLSGVAITKYIYNEYGKKIRETFFNALNQRTVNNNGVNSIEHLYDKYQRYIGYQNYDHYNLPVNNRLGISSQKRTLNNAGYVSSYEYFDNKKRPVLGPDGYYKVVYQQDDSQLLIKESLYDTDNSLIANYQGIAEYEYTRASSGLISSMKYYDEKGKPIEDSDGVSEVYYDPDMNGLYFMGKQLNIKGEEIETDDS
ncbi:hypothetical protein [Aquimarina sp. 2201CG5-10]|uniref:hypothetical protein n=1 Tax=Aquimarina callyspongiae TaxID=3098150 RepID=UPI002AB497A6|nr:hypothetical protein [Aquimarina sp. 2201CG5-10]MDY8136339.1 hypothetical protein [Aquimarina sp. 2201CG5-10]